MHIAAAPQWAYFVVFIDAAVVIPAAVAALIAAQRSRRGDEKAALALSVALVAWFGIALALGSAHVFQSHLRTVPWIALGVGAPIVLAFLVYRASPGVQRAVQALPQTWLLAAQFPRIVGGAFLILMLQHRLPRDFALPAGFGDLLVGVLGPLVAVACATRRTWARQLAVAFNFLGIADLIIAVGTGFLTSPTQIRLFHSEPSTALMTIIPMVLVPTFLVPFWILVHAASLRGLRAEAPVPGVARPASRSRGTAAGQASIAP